MKRNTLTAVGIAAAFALPFAAQASAELDTMILAQSGGPSGASAVGTGPTGGMPRTGGPGPADASAGRPKDFTGHPVGGADASAGASGAAGAPVIGFSDLDRNNDGQISRAEWNANAGSASGGASSGNAATTDRTPASSLTGTTAGPGSVSPRTGPGAATATSPSTSGHGKPK